MSIAPGRDQYAEDNRVRDPVHGYIRYNTLERDIVNSTPFQRLRRIRQLGPTYLVYPGAEHSRFQHSIGVMHVASRAFDLIVQKCRDKLAWTAEDRCKYRQLLRVAALLHDIGHAPFSHASEKLFPEGHTHEGFGAHIVSSEPLRGLIDSHRRDTGIGAEDVADFIARKTLDPKAAFLLPILNGDLDADKMDYLLRDSLFCGVAYGRFDLERVLHTLTLRNDEVAGNWVIAIEEEGLQSAEGLVLARYFMFAQVYFHKTRRSYDHLLETFLRGDLPGGRFPANSDDFLQWDDLRVWGRLLDGVRAGNGVARRVVDRDHFREVYATSLSMKSHDEVLWTTMMEAFLRDFPDVEYFVDESSNVPQKFRRADFHVVVSRERSVPIIRRSPLVATLEPIYQRRLYVGKENKERIKTYCDAHESRHLPKKTQEEV